MNESASLPDAQPRRLWVRALYMLLMGIAFHVAAWCLVITAVLQLIFAAVGGGRVERLRDFGQAVGRYLAQIAEFVSFATEDVPFPFSDWPSAVRG